MWNETSTTSWGKKLKWNLIHHLGTKYIAKINKLQRWSFLSVIHEMNVHEWRVLNFAKFFIIYELPTYLQL